jgi:carboxyl-terminal processing protease
MTSLIAALALQSFAPGDYRKDLHELVTSLDQYGAYVHADGLDLKVLEAKYSSIFASVQSRDQYLIALEGIMGELHDFHASLGTNNDHSPRLVPSGTDIIATWHGGRAIIDQVRIGSLAEKSGLVHGDEIVKIQDMSATKASDSWIGSASAVMRVKNCGLNSALAGRWNVKRKLVIKHASTVREVVLDTALTPRSKKVLTFEMRPGGIAYLRPEDSLGESDLIKELDALVPELRKARSIVIDLRNTGSGGTSSVARGMMGLFISRRLPYQRHRVIERDTKTVRDWVEYATPRLSKPINAKLVVLVGRWTGSMGEGIAIGFDAMNRATVIGTPMAGLRGAVDNLELPQSHIRIFFPTEQVFHVNGTPRHEWVPPVHISYGSKDPWWNMTISVLAKQ